MELLPHRFPFLMVDRMVDVVLGESATGIKNVTANDNFLQGHFPSKPVMPGVMIIEAMAQTAGDSVVMPDTVTAGGEIVSSIWARYADIVGERRLGSLRNTLAALLDAS